MGHPVAANVGCLELKQTHIRWKAEGAMQQHSSFSGNPVEMARSLVRENTLDRARPIAVEGTTYAHEQSDFYRLSVWREVKLILQEWTENSE